MPKYKSPGSFRSVHDFREHFRSLDPEMDCDLRLLGSDGPLCQSIQIGGRQLTNRFAVQPMEGWDANGDGGPSVHTFRRWRRFGESGAKLVWGGEAVAVQRDGRANPNQLFINQDIDSRRWLAELNSTVRSAHRRAFHDESDLVVGLQLTHSGRYAQPNSSRPEPKLIAHHADLDKKHGLPADLPLLTDTELGAIRDNFVRAAIAASDAGFDFVDVKCCHGYLLHDSLSCKNRPGSYGGVFENRTRLFREIVQGIQTACPSLLIGVRVSIADVGIFERDENTGEAVSFGAQAQSGDSELFGFANKRSDWTEPCQFLSLVQSLGIELVNITIGSPYYCPHAQRPFAYPPSDGYFPPEDPLFGVIRHLKTVRRVRAEFPSLAIVGSGYSYLQEYLAHVAQYEIRQRHVDFVGLGRMMLAYPDFPADVLAGRQLQRKHICRTFSDCTTGPRNGLISGCFPLDDYYRKMPIARQIKKMRAFGRVPDGSE